VTLLVLGMVKRVGRRCSGATCMEYRRWPHFYPHALPDLAPAPGGGWFRGVSGTSDLSRPAQLGRGFLVRWTTSRSGMACIRGRSVHQNRYARSIASRKLEISRCSCHRHGVPVQIAYQHQLHWCVLVLLANFVCVDRSKDSRWSKSSSGWSGCSRQGFQYRDTR
jgi:hypothetical protein